MNSENEGFGIRLLEDSATTFAAIVALLDYFHLGGLVELIRQSINGMPVIDVALRAGVMAEWMPSWDTTQLPRRLTLDTLHNTFHLELEILITLLASPVSIGFPSVAELQANIHIRRNIVT